MASPCISDSSTVHLFMQGANLAAEVVPDPLADNHTLIHVAAGVYSTVYRGQSFQNADDETGYELNDDALHTFLEATGSVGPNNDPFLWVCQAVLAWDPFFVALFNGAATFAITEELDLVASGLIDTRRSFSTGGGDAGGGVTTLAFTVNPGATATLHWRKTLQRTSNLGNSLGWNTIPRGYGLSILRVG